MEFQRGDKVSERYIVTQENAVKDVETGIVWEISPNKVQAQEATRQWNTVQQARREGCERPCGAVFGWPNCMKCWTGEKGIKWNSSEVTR